MKTVSFGRSSENDVVVQDVLVSGRHLLLSSDEAGKLFAEDLNSTNGTWIDEVLLRGGRQAITYNSLIKIGETVLEWQNYFRNTEQAEAKLPIVQPESILPAETPIVQPESVLPAETPIAQPKSVLPAETPITQPKSVLPTTESPQIDKPTQWLFWTAVGMGGFYYFYYYSGILLL